MQGCTLPTVLLVRPLTSFNKCSTDMWLPLWKSTQRSNWLSIHTLKSFVFACFKSPNTLNYWLHVNGTISEYELSKMPSLQSLSNSWEVKTLPWDVFPNNNRCNFSIRGCFPYFNSMIQINCLKQSKCMITCGDKWH